MTNQSPAPVAGAVEAKRLVSHLVAAACLQEREPSEVHQNAYRAARDAVEAALHPQPAPAVVVEAAKVDWYERHQDECTRDFGEYDESAPLATRLRWWVPKSARHGRLQLEDDLLEASEALAARTAPAVAEKVPLRDPRMEKYDHDGMIAAFEMRYGQSWTDKDWRSETATWTAAWRAGRSASAVAESQWRTMESAPKDGTHILAMLPDSETCHIICWVDASKGIRVGCGVYGWHVAWDGYPCAGYSAPTHWMPLPAPPTVGSGSAQEGQANG